MWIRSFLAASLLFATPLGALADDAKPAPAAGPKDARIVPVLRDGVFVGLKVYAIRAGGRFDQPTAKFQNGDTIEQVDGLSITTPTAGKALQEKLVLGHADATVTVRRGEKLVELHSKAAP